MEFDTGMHPSMDIWKLLAPPNLVGVQHWNWLTVREMGKYRLFIPNESSKTINMMQSIYGYITLCPTAYDTGSCVMCFL